MHRVYEQLLTRRTTAATVTSVAMLAIGVGLVPLAIDAAGATITPVTARDATAPERPSQILFAVIFYRNEKITPNGGGTFNLTHVSVKQHELDEKGLCNPKDPYQPSMEETDYGLAGVRYVSCKKGPNGVNLSKFYPRSSLTYPPSLAAMNFAPVLDQQGDRAAQSVGDSGRHGTPTQIALSFTKGANPGAVAEISYANGSSSSVGPDLKELRLILRGKGAETVERSLY